MNVTIKCPAHAGWTYCLLLSSPDSKRVFAEGVDKRSLRDPSLTKAEKEKMIRLQRWYDAKFEPVAEDDSSSVSRRTQKGEKTWMTVVDRDFCDLTVEVGLEVARVRDCTDLEVYCR